MPIPLQMAGRPVLAAITEVTASPTQYVVAKPQAVVTATEYTTVTVTVDADFEYSLDGGMTWTAAPTGAVGIDNVPCRAFDVGAEVLRVRGLSGSLEVAGVFA